MQDGGAVFDPCVQVATPLADEAARARAKNAVIEQTGDQVAGAIRSLEFQAQHGHRLLDTVAAEIAEGSDVRGHTFTAASLSLSKSRPTGRLKLRTKWSSRHSYPCTILILAVATPARRMSTSANTNTS